MRENAHVMATCPPCSTVWLSAIVPIAQSHLACALMWRCPRCSTLLVCQAYVEGEAVLRPC